MEKQKTTPEVSAQQQEPASPPEKKSGLFGKLKIIFIVVFVIVVECVLAYLYLPSAAGTAAMAGSSLENKNDDKSAAKKKETEKDQDSEVEVDLGEFNVTAYQPVSNTTLRIDFHLYGTVALKDKADFMSRLEENLHRFRDQVIITVRSSEITDLTDAGLGIVKRKIMDKTNRMMGKQLMQTIIFSDFSFIEQ